MPVTINGTTGITTPNLINGSSLNFRNKIINGNFDIWQRGTSLASGTGARYLADRWTNGSATTTYTPSRQAFTAGQPDVPNEPAFFHRTVVVSGGTNGSNATLHQHIESVRTFAGKTVTLSFYAKTPTAPENVAIEFYQYFGTTGGSPAVSIPAGSFNLTSSWQKFTVTVNIPSISSKTIGSSNDDYLTVYFWFDAGSNFAARASSIGYQSGTFDIAEVQVEEGSVATPFEERPIGTELALCQRYYTKSYPIEVPVGAISSDGIVNWRSTYNAANGDYNSVEFKVTMRAKPQVSLYSPHALNVIDRWYDYTLGDGSTTRDVLAQHIGSNGFMARMNSVPVTHSVGGNWTADAEL